MVGIVRIETVVVAADGGEGCKTDAVVVGG